MQSTIHTASLVTTAAAAVSYMIASSEDMRVACADGTFLAMTAITGGAGGAAWSALCANRVSAPAPAPTATASPPTSAPPTEGGHSFVVHHLAQRTNVL